MARPIGLSRRKRNDTFEGVVGTVVAQYRVKKGFSQAVLADQLRCDISYISQLERGLINPSLSRGFEIAEALGMSAAMLVRKVSDEFDRAKPKRRKALT
jgi:transcriptional regulator with XRE-family HTH domain